MPKSSDPRRWKRTRVLTSVSSSVRPRPTKLKTEFRTSGGSRTTGTLCRVRPGSRLLTEVCGPRSGSAGTNQLDDVVTSAMGVSLAEPLSVAVALAVGVSAGRCARRDGRALVLGRYGDVVVRCRRTTAGVRTAASAARLCDGNCQAFPMTWERAIRTRFPVIVRAVALDA